MIYSRPRGQHRGEGSCASRGPQIWRFTYGQKACRAAACIVPAQRSMDGDRILLHLSCLKESGAGGAFSLEDFVPVRI